MNILYLVLQFFKFQFQTCLLAGSYLTSTYSHTLLHIQPYLTPHTAIPHSTYSHTSLHIQPYLTSTYSHTSLHTQPYLTPHTPIPHSTHSHTSLHIQPYLTPHTAASNLGYSRDNILSLATAMSHRTSGW